MFGLSFKRRRAAQSKVLEVDPSSTAGQVYSLAAQVSSLRTDENASKAIGLVSVDNPTSIQNLSIDFAIALTRFIDGSVLLVHPSSKRTQTNRAASLQTHELFGWNDVVEGACQIQEVVKKTSINRLNILDFGIPKRSSRAATSAAEKDITTQSIQTTLRTLKKDYEFIVFQLPSVSQDVTALSLASVLDGVILVIDHRATRMSQVKKFSDFLENHHVHVVGAVMNRYQHFLPSILRRK